jgi:peptidoglycan hydrolase-like protein with peptidoglycan-binding domain
MVLLALVLVLMAVLSFFSVTNAQVISGSSTLTIGSSGAQVSALQQFLAADPAIYPEGLVTGYFGPLTQAAVMRYQCQAPPQPRATDR